MAKHNKKLIYQCIQPDNIKIIHNIYKEHKVAEHIEHLYQLILYQLQEIHSYRSGTIADKHREIWRNYDNIILNSTIDEKE